MLFNSFIFFVFFFVVYSLYLSLRSNYRYQNTLLLIASYLFYGSWNWKFLFLILLSSVVDFFIARGIYFSENPVTRKYYLTISILTNLSILGFFKYSNFFVESFVQLLNTFGMSADQITLNIILPVGISFYTFQTMSYTIDIYRRRLEPAHNFFDFALFVSFFPQLVAGPIERATHLLPQILSPRKITLAKIDSGIFLILWGLFKKVVIADNVGLISDQVFNGYTQFEGLDLLIGILAFTVQIYCDFSGYSDIARGICKLLGFELMVNFRLPYFALNPSDFWNRWHISLSSWLRDYLYISLGGNRKGNLNTYRNLILTMLLGGLWHGASWNFVIWGAYHGSILSIYRFFHANHQNTDPWSARYPNIILALKLISMFTLTLIGWVIFRCQSVHQIAYMLKHSLFLSFEVNFKNAFDFLFYSMPLVLIQIWQHRSGDLLIVTKQTSFIRGLIYALLIFGLVVFGARESMEFIYFQF